MLKVPMVRLSPPRKDNRAASCLQETAFAPCYFFSGLIATSLKNTMSLSL